MRTKVPPAIETELLLCSARRCCLCLGLRFDADEKAGQVAHLDGDPNNHNLDNLAWLCLYHHDSFDGRTSQSKGLTIGEVKAHRARLYEIVAARSQSSASDATSSIRSDERNEEVLRVVHRYEFISDSQVDALKQEIITRLQKIFSFCNSLVHEYGRLNEWLQNVSELVEDWTNGWLKFDECTELMWELDERYDFDLHYLLYGIPNAKLNAVTYRLLMSLAYEFGMRNLRDKEDLTS
jgi:hypothetical protein